MAKASKRFGNPARAAAYERARSRKLSHKAALTNVTRFVQGLDHYKQLAEILEQQYGPDFRDLAHGTFIYGCGSCVWQHVVWLSVGVEGPKGIRLQIPAPFGCGQCPWCGGRLRHVRPGDDQHFDEPVPVPEGAAKFFVPVPHRMRGLADVGAADYSDPQRSSR